MVNKGKLNCTLCSGSGYEQKYGADMPCSRCNPTSSGGAIKKLTVTSDNEREQWVKLLKLASDYHFDMSGQFEPEVKSINADTKEERVAQVHRAWGRAIQEAADLISFWEIESATEVRTPPARNITKEIENAEPK